MKVIGSEVYAGPRAIFDAVKRALLPVLALAASVALGAQQPPAADPAAVPIEQEPRHRLVFANEFVRVLDVMLPPLYVSQHHTHTYDNVAVTILPGIDGPQGQGRIGFAGYARGGYSHVITNPNIAPMRFIAVELRGPDHSAELDAVPQDAHHTVLANGKVRISRISLSAGEKLEAHQHADGYVSVIVRGGDGPGIWKWHPAGEPAATVDPGKFPLEFVEIEPR